MQSCQIGLINRELSFIYVSELKVAAFSCQIDDLVVPIWPYQFFNALQSDRQSDPNTVLNLDQVGYQLGLEVASLCLNLPFLF